MVEIDREQSSRAISFSLGNGRFEARIAQNFFAALCPAPRWGLPPQTRQPISGRTSPSARTARHDPWEGRGGGMPQALSEAPVRREGGHALGAFSGTNHAPRPGAPNPGCFRRYINGIINQTVRW